MMIKVIMLKALGESTQLEGSLCLLYGMCRKEHISSKMRWWHCRKLVFSFLKCHPINLFSDDASLCANKSTNADNWPKIWNGKNIYRALVFKIFTQQQNKWEARHVLLANILPPTNVIFPKYGKIYIIISGPIGNCK
jgi:hypothetical protein